MRWAGRSSSASSRSSESARCAPRLVPATACTSSTITVSTPRSDSRACEVSSRNSDSGVVMRMSGGVRREAARRSSAGVSPERIADGDVGRRQAEARRRRAAMPASGARRLRSTSTAERLERGDVEHPAAALRLSGARRAGQPVERPQERGQRLARAGRRDDSALLAGGDRRPGAGLGGGRRGEGACEPRPGRRGRSGRGPHRSYRSGDLVAHPRHPDPWHRQVGAMLSRRAPAEPDSGRPQDSPGQG